MDKIESTDIYGYLKQWHTISFEDLEGINFYKEANDLRETLNNLKKIKLDNNFNSKINECEVMIKKYKLGKNLKEGLTNMSAILYDNSIVFKTLVIKDSFNLKSMNTYTSATITPKFFAVADIVLASAAKTVQLMDITDYLVSVLTDEDILPYKIKNANNPDTVSRMGTLFARAIKHSVSKNLKHIKGLSNDISITDTDNLTANDLKYATMGSGFIAKYLGNLVYTGKRWWLNKKFKHYKLNKKKAQLLNLKLLELKEKSKGEDNDVNLLKEINYYEVEISKLYKSIKEFEEDNDDGE